MLYGNFNDKFIELLNELETGIPVIKPAMIVINGLTIHQDVDRCCLNYLHNASVCADKDSLSNFARTKKGIELLEVLKSQNW